MTSLRVRTELLLSYGPTEPRKICAQQDQVPSEKEDSWISAILSRVSEHARELLPPVPTGAQSCKSFRRSAASDKSPSTSEGAARLPTQSPSPAPRVPASAGTPSAPRRDPLRQSPSPFRARRR